MNITDIPAGTLRAAVLRVLADEVKTAADDGKSGLLDVMAALGIKTLVAALPGGSEVATVTRAGGGESPKVTDPAKFLAWVTENHPTETEPVVRESYRKTLLGEIAKAGEPVDPATGEVVPGVEFTSSSPYLVVTFAKGDVTGQELIKEAWRDGKLSLPDLLALPAAEVPGE